MSKYNDNRYIKRWTNFRRAADMLGGKCSKCGEDHVATLSFHHVDPGQKTEDVARLIQGSDWQLIEQEVLKCVLLCENCHRKLHFDEERYKTHLEEITNRAAGILTQKVVKIKKWGDKDTEQLIRLYEDGISVQEIAGTMNRMDCTIRTRINRMVEEGKLTERDPVKRKTKVVITDDLKRQIKDLSDQFLSPLEISLRLGVSLRTVFKYQKGE